MSELAVVIEIEAFDGPRLDEVSVPGVDNVVDNEGMPAIAKEASPAVKVALKVGGTSYAACRSSSRCRASALLAAVASSLIRVVTPARCRSSLYSLVTV